MYFHTDYNSVLFLNFEDLLMAKVACCIKLFYLIERRGGEGFQVFDCDTDQGSPMV